MLSTSDAQTEKMVKHTRYLVVYFNEYMEYDFTAAQFAESGQRALGSVIHKYKYYPDVLYKTFGTLCSNYVAPVRE